MRGIARRRVLHVCDALLNPSETFIQQRLVGRNFEPRAMAWRRVDAGLEIPCPAVFLPEPSDPSVAWPDRLFGRRLRDKMNALRAIRREEPDVVHAHFGTIALRVDRLCRLLRIPLVVSFYGYDAGSALADPAIRRGYTRLFASIAAVTAEGPALARRLLSLGAAPDTVKLLPLALPEWATKPPERSVAPHDPTLRLLQVARFTEKKGVDTTLRAVAAARAAGAQVRLVLAGDGPLNGALREAAGELRLGDTVEFVGFVTHASLPRHFGSAHALVQPSRTAADGDTEGGAPTVLAEAQAQGLPVLATTHADIPNVVRHGLTGLLVAEGDHEALGRWIVRLATDRDLLGRLGAAARPFALRRHDPGLVLALRERVYREAIRS